MVTGYLSLVTGKQPADQEISHLTVDTWTANIFYEDTPVKKELDES